MKENGHVWKAIVVIAIALALVLPISANVEKLDNDIDIASTNDRQIIDKPMLSVNTNNIKETIESSESSIDWWPMYKHDPQHTSYSTSDAPDTNNILWNRDISPYRSSPAIVDGRAYIGSYDNNTYCLDAMDGTQIWSFTTGHRVESSPAVVNGMVFVGSLDRNFYCLNAQDGSLIWSFTTDGGISSSPAIDDGKIFFASNDENLYCLALNGSLIWSRDISAYESSPAVANGRVFIGSPDRNLYCLDASDGSEIWSYSTNGWTCRSSPTVADGMVYIGAEYPDNSLYCLDASDGSFIWNYTLGNYVGSFYGLSPSVADGMVFIGNADNHNPKVFCLNAMNGSEIWNYSVYGVVSPSPAIADGKAYVGSNWGFYCLDEFDGSLIWCYDTPGQIHSSAAIADGRVYVGSNCEFYCFGPSEHDIDWWSMYRHDLRHTGFSTSLAPDTNKTLWTYAADADIGQAPAVVGGRVFFCFHGRYNGLCCLNEVDGSFLWQFDTGYYAQITPAVSEGRVVFISNYNVYCLNVTDGSLIWTNRTGDTNSFSDPMIVDGKVFFGLSYPNMGMYCLNLSDGSEIWYYSTGGQGVESSPAIVDGKVFFGCGDGYLYCLDAENGSLIWKSYRTGYSIVSSPAIINGKVFVGSHDHKVYCFNASDGSHIWNYTTGDLVYGSPAVAYGNVYICSKDYNIYCLNMENGSLIWSYATDDEMYRSPAVADGKVYFGSFDGKLYCLDAINGSLIWTCATDERMGEPAIANGKVFVGFDDDMILYCFGSEQPNQPPYPPSNPDPYDGETNVDINADLSWTGGDPDAGDNVTYDVYFGTTSPPPKIVSNQSVTTCDPDLDYETQYYWQIVAWDNHDAFAEGPIWDFTTEEEDTTPPVTTCKLDGIMEGGIYISNVTVILNATDDLSGVNRTMYKIDYSKYYEYTDPFIVSEEGDHIIYFYSVDNVGNWEDYKNETFTIQHPCSIEIEVSGGIGVNAVITNTGDMDIIDLEWSITIIGGILGLIDKEVNGTIPTLTVDDSATIKSGIFFGLGSIDVTVIVGDVEETRDGIQLIIFTKIVEK